MDALWDCLSCCYDVTTTIELRNPAVLSKRLEQTAQIMLEVLQDLHNEYGVIIQIVDEAAHADNDDFSGYWFDTAIVSKLANAI